MIDGVTISAARPGDMTIAAQLFRDYSIELGVDLGFQDFTAELKALPGAYAPPRGALLLAFETTGTALGCVAMRPMSDPQICEMKRLHVSAAGRGRGIGAGPLRSDRRCSTRGRICAYAARYIETLGTSSLSIPKNGICSDTGLL